MTTTVKVIGEGDQASARAWVALAVGLPLLIAVSMTLWSARHRAPTSWDEANYVLQVRRDLEYFQNEGPLRLAKSLVFTDVQRPPAYRLLAFPATLCFGVDLAVLRAVSHLAYLVTLLLVWFAVRSVADEPRAALAVTLAASSPGVVNSFVCFGTEYALFLAIAFLLFAQTRSNRADAASTAVGVALGMLAKSSFILVAVPFLAFRLMRREARIPVVVGTSAGLLVALPWWFWNVRSALVYADWGRRFPRAALTEGGSGLVTSLERFGWGTVGVGAIVAIVIVLVRGRCRSELLPLAAACVVLPCVALSSPFLIERHVAPAILPLSVLIGLAGRPRAIAGGLLAIQALVLVIGAPRTPLPLAYLVAPLEEKCSVDWSFLSREVSSNGLVTFIGLAPGLTPPEIAFALDSSRPAEVVWLWRMEEGPPRWDDIGAMAAQSDVVLFPDPDTVAPDQRCSLSAPDLRIHNSVVRPFARSIEKSGRFEPCERIRVPALSSYDLMMCRRRRDDPPRNSLLLRRLLDQQAARIHAAVHAPRGH